MSDTNLVTDFQRLRSGQMAFQRLVALLNKREAEILADPIQHLGNAGKIIAEQAQFIESLREELFQATAVRVDYRSSSPAPRACFDNVTVDRREWEAWGRIKAMLRARNR